MIYVLGVRLDGEPFLLKRKTFGYLLPFPEILFCWRRVFGRMEDIFRAAP